MNYYERKYIGYLIDCISLCHHTRRLGYLRSFNRTLDKVRERTSQRIADMGLVAIAGREIETIMNENKFEKPLVSLKISLQIIANALWKYHEYCTRELAVAIEDGLLSQETIKTCRKNIAEIFRLANLFGSIIDAQNEESKDESNND